jgi:uncharacterized RDD family membrane protein YckC
METKMKNMEYAGFWIRTGASLIDTLLMMIIIFPLLTAIYGKQYWGGNTFFFGFWDLLLNYILPGVVVIIFWIYKSATPGKMALRLKIVDSRTGQAASTGQLIGRYFGYYISTIPLLLGFVWVGIDKRKQGFHDKLSGTVVIRNTEKESVQFEG